MNIVKAASASQTSVRLASPGAGDSDSGVLRIMVVDGNATSRAWLGAVLGRMEASEVTAYGEPRKALVDAAVDPPDLLLVSYLMPGLDGISFLEALRREVGATPLKSALITGRPSDALRAAAQAVGVSGVLPRPLTTNSLFAALSGLLPDRWDAVRPVVDARPLPGVSALLQCLERVASVRDSGTGRHTLRMARYAREIALALGRPRAWCDALERAAPLHDLGKVAIPDAILFKAGSLDEHERSVMRTHAGIGHSLLAGLGDATLSMAADIALNHHECFDGSGYPRGISGRDIPLAARIVALADVFDALCSERPYKPRWDIEKAWAYILQRRGRQFDPEVVDASARILPQLARLQGQFDIEQAQLLEPGANRSEVSA